MCVCVCVVLGFFLMGMLVLWVTGRNITGSRLKILLYLNTRDFNTSFTIKSINGSICFQQFFQHVSGITYSNHLTSGHFNWSTSNCLKWYQIGCRRQHVPVVRSLLNAGLCRSYLSWLFHSSVALYNITVRAVTFCDCLNVIQDGPFFLFFK